MMDGLETEDALAHRQLLTDEERRRRMLESIARYLGPAALEPVVYFESDWASDEWTGGAYATSFDLGGLSRWGHDQRVPVGPIRFSSSDIAAEGFQHVDGAIRVGHDVAAEILAERDAGAEHAEHADTGAAVS